MARYRRRRSRSNLLSDIFEVGQKLPWWITFSIALLLFALTPYLIDSLIRAPSDSVVASAVVNGIKRPATVFLQFGIPLILVFSLLATEILTFRGKYLLNRERKRPDAGARSPNQFTED